MAYIVCYKWENANIAWPRADWTWSECRLVDELVSCIWGQAGVLWKDAGWWWNKCPFAPTTEETIQRPGVDATTLIQPWLEEPWNPYRSGETKKKKLIRLICKIKGQEFDESKETKDIKITIDDIKLVVKSVKGIDLDLKMEK